LLLLIWQLDAAFIWMDKSTVGVSSVIKMSSLRISVSECSYFIFVEPFHKI
jgi:hypothetical protein